MKRSEDDVSSLSDDEIIGFLAVLAKEVLDRGLVLNPSLAVATGDDLLIAKANQWLVANMLTQGVPPRDAAALTKRLADATVEIRKLIADSGGAGAGIEGADAKPEPFDAASI